MTRIDLTADLFDGQYTPEQCELDYLAGGMSLTNNRPFAKRDGDWYDNGGGKTHYVGKRESGKLLRVYEKGKQILGNLALRAIGEDHRSVALLNWVRVEVELRSTGRILQLEMLLNPGGYLAGAYPALNFLSEVQIKLETIKKTAVATIERAIEVLSAQFGAWVLALIAVKGVDVIKELTKGKTKVPAWAVSLDALPSKDDDRWNIWQKEMALIPF
jgi:phage replication initiation protein